MSSTGLDPYVERFCDYCGNPLEGRRPNTKYCSGRCRTAAWEQRRSLTLSDSLANVLGEGCSR